MPGRLIIYRALQLRLRSRRARFLCAGLFSLIVHIFIVLPFGIARLLMPPPAPDLEVAFLTEEPEDDAPPEEVEAPPDPAKVEAQKTPPKQELAQAEPEPEDPARRPENKQKPEEQKRPPLEVLPNAHLKMVDQEQFEDEADNPDANYLAQKNHRAEVETRATDTNLLRNQQGERASTEGAQAGPQPGDESRKIAELQDHAGAKDRLPVQNQPRGEHPESDRKDPSQSTALSMRDQQTAPPEQKPERREGLELQEQEDGPLPVQRSGEDKEVARAPQGGAPGRFSLSHDDYDRIVGFDVAERERREALAQRSRSPGRWERLQQKMAMMRSSLENFTPTVRPGNQSELGTRRHPFAAYIAQMHRQIHKFWGFGYLVELDGKPASSPLNDMGLWTSVEIKLSPDGRIERMTLSKLSGQSTFDAAAMDAVMSSGPFQPPPDVIKSSDGYVYLDWRFHRDGRQCATDWVEPHILNLGKGAKVASAPAAPSPSPAPRPAQEGERRLTLLPGGGGGGGRQRGRAQDRDSGEEGGGEGGGAPRPGEATQVPPAAAEVAQKWLAAYERGDARWLAGFSAVPFTAAGKTVAEEGPELKEMYRQMLAERSERQGTVTLYTPAQIRKRLGRVPAGGDEDGMVFAWVKCGRDDLVLLLQQADRGWRVVGIDR
jgi:hypothetical protein